MTHYDKIPALLDHAMTCSIAEAARRTGISPSLPWKWLVQSRLGKAELQAITWCDVVAPFHIQLDNLKLLSVSAIEQSAVERALNGCYAPVFFQGVRQFEDVLRPEYEGKTDDELMFEVGPDYKIICYERVPTMQWLKPSDALVIKTLEAWKRRRWGAHQQIDVTYGGRLTLQKDTPPEAATLDAPAVELFDGEAEDGPEQRGGYLALAAPAKTSDEFEERAAAGEFAPAEVTFRKADGQRAALRPDIEQLRRQAEELRKNGPKNPYPTDAMGRRLHPLSNLTQGRNDPADDGGRGVRPVIEPKPYIPPPVRASEPERPDHPADDPRVGYGPDPERVGGHQGFKVA